MNEFRNMLLAEDLPTEDFDELLLKLMKEAEGVTEELKEKNQLEWVQRMGNIQQRAREIVCVEIIYT